MSLMFNCSLTNLVTQNKLAYSRTPPSKPRGASGESWFTVHQWS